MTNHKKDNKETVKAKLRTLPFSYLTNINCHDNAKKILKIVPENNGMVIISGKTNSGVTTVMKNMP